MEVVGQFHAPIALTSGNKTEVGAGQEPGWDLEPVWNLWKEKYIYPFQKSNPDSSVVQTVGQSICRVI
jgi:hypothetical protein